MFILATLMSIQRVFQLRGSPGYNPAVDIVFCRQVTALLNTLIEQAFFPLALLTRFERRNILVIDFFDYIGVLGKQGLQGVL